MSLDNRPEDSPEIERVDDLVDHFAAGEKDPAGFRVGMEHEKIGLTASGLTPVRYYGDKGIERIFQILVERRGFTPYREGHDTIALIKDGTNVSLEPGGQLELSGAVLHDVHEICHELTEHRELTRALGEELDIVWLGIGHHPFARREDIEWVPKQRYAIMRRYLPTRGHRALDMMLRTGTVQANFDWASEADMARKMRTAMAVSPLVSAIYANSPIVEGGVTGWVSERQRIWRDVDPDRTGILPFVFDRSFGYREYVEWALDVPMFFIRRRGRYVAEIAGTPFRAFLREGFQGYRAQLSDWDDHLTTLFPEVRIKGYLEVRGADCCDRDLNCAFPALWKGLLYDDEAMDAAWALTAGWNLGERVEALMEVARYGLEAKVGGRSVLDLARELVAVSAAGLARQGRLDAKGRDERRFLEPVQAVLEGGRSPGRLLAEAWEGELGRAPRRLVERCRF